MGRGALQGRKEALNLTVRCVSVRRARWRDTPVLIVTYRSVSLDFSLPTGNFNSIFEGSFGFVFLEEMEVVMEKECSALGGLFQAIINDMKVKMNIIYHLCEVYFFIWLFMFANICVIMKILLLLLLLLIIYSFIFTIIKTFTIVKTVSIVVVVQNRRVWLITDER